MAIIHDVEGWVFVTFGVMSTCQALPVLMRARRGRKLTDADAMWVRPRLAVALGVLLDGVLVLRDPRSPHGTTLNWLPLAFIAVALVLLGLGIVSGRRARPLGPGSAEVPGSGPATTLDPSTGMIERIRNARFSTTRLAPGYDEEEVDAFLDKLVAVLTEGGQLSHSALHDARFSRTRLRPGYAMQDVDAFLVEVTSTA